MLFIWCPESWNHYLFLQILVRFNICVLCREFTGHCRSISTSEVGFWKGWSRHSLEFPSNTDRNRCCPENAPRPLHLSHSGDLRCGKPLTSSQHGYSVVSWAPAPHSTRKALLESSHTLEDAEDSRSSRVSWGHRWQAHSEFTRGSGSPQELRKTPWGTTQSFLNYLQNIPFRIMLSFRFSFIILLTNVFYPKRKGLR